jgi:hypothetical protein
MSMDRLESAEIYSWALVTRRVAPQSLGFLKRPLNFLQALEVECTSIKEYSNIKGAVQPN